MSYETDIATALAELLAAKGVGVWRPDGAYPDGTTPAIYMGLVPEVARPVITITTYPVEATLNPNDSVLGVQVRTRAPGRDPRPTTDLDGRIFDILHGMTNVPLGGWRVTKILFQSGAIMGQDDSERWSRTANYYLTGPRWPA